MNENSCLVDNKGKSSFKYIIFFVIFFTIGVGLGVVTTRHFLKDKNNDSSSNDNVSETSDGFTDITNSLDYKNTLEKLVKVINGNVEFYDTKGINISTMPNELKLKLVYSNILKNNNQFETQNVNSTQWGSTTCDGGFIVASLSNDDGSEYLGGYCTLNKVPYSMFKEVYSSLFNVGDIDVTQEVVIGNKKCVPSDDTYLCGEIYTDVTGELSSKFNVIKATIDEDKNIRIYEKGYLVDTRSNIVNPDDGFDNYYLHSYDSNLYYYELKSSENLTFIHKFKLDSNNNYFYESTELEKK